jgi:hypothetical protein
MIGDRTLCRKRRAGVRVRREGVRSLEALAEASGFPKN